MTETGSAATLINSSSFIKTCGLIGIGALFGYTIGKEQHKNSFFQRLFILFFQIKFKSKKPF